MRRRATTTITGSFPHASASGPRERAGASRQRVDRAAILIRVLAPLLAAIVGFGCDGQASRSDCERYGAHFKSLSEKRMAADPEVRKGMDDFLTLTGETATSVCQVEMKKSQVKCALAADTLDGVTKCRGGKRP